jgi:hypothetical protein
MLEEYPSDPEKLEEVLDEVHPSEQSKIILEIYREYISFLIEESDDLGEEEYGL